MNRRQALKGIALAAVCGKVLPSEATAEEMVLVPVITSIDHHCWEVRQEYVRLPKDWYNKAIVFQGAINEDGVYHLQKITDENGVYHAAR